MFQPAMGMPALRIAMCPVNHTAARIALEFAIKRDDIPRQQGCDSWRKINVVRDQYRSS